MSETEQNKTEEATPFKLKRAREKGQIARGTDLGFFSTLTAFSLFLVMAGENMAYQMTTQFRLTLIAAMSRAEDPATMLEAVSLAVSPAMRSLALLGFTVFVVVAFLEILQNRGITFSTHPLKPDFNRLNPGQGLKRVFSMRMLKETLKSILKLFAYALAVYLIVRFAMTTLAPALSDPARTASSFYALTLRLTFTCLAVAFCAMVLDQILARQEFSKKMKMSRSELNREHKEREGEPRQKQKRKKLHAEFAKQTRGIGSVKGSDLMIVNPEHFAIALSYDPRTMSAPKLIAKGRNRFALLMKQEALVHGITVFEDPPLARALFKSTEPGREVPAEHYRAVATKYLTLRARRAPEPELN